MSANPQNARHGIIQDSNEPGIHLHAFKIESNLSNIKYYTRFQSVYIILNTDKCMYRNIKYLQKVLILKMKIHGISPIIFPRIYFAIFRSCNNWLDKEIKWNIN